MHVCGHQYKCVELLAAKAFKICMSGAINRVCGVDNGNQCKTSGLRMDSTLRAAVADEQSCSE